MTKKRNILLIEPKYKNKYPPIGLMKIATYHKMLGDNIEFFKGDLNDLILDKISEDCINKLYNIDKEYEWYKKFSIIREYIKTKKINLLIELEIENSKYSVLLENCFNSFSNIYRKKDYKNFPKWDRIYITTLFTFYWNVTIESIHSAKNLVKKIDDIMIGGVLASLLHNEIELETGIKPFQGLLDKPGILDPKIKKAQKIIVDNLPLDYSILDEIDYEYPTGSAYFTFMTKGCTRKCAFCSVPILEPTYKPKVDTIDKFDKIKEIYGEQQNLLLMDNNVLASPNFPEIIQEIKDMGFKKGATYVEPNQLDIAVKNLKKGINNKAYVKRSYILIHNLFKRLYSNKKQEYYDILDKYDLIKIEPTTEKGILIAKNNILLAYKEIAIIYERYRYKVPRKRYVDFNQGTDARYVTDELMKLMSEIPIRPLRIAFDYWSMNEQYKNAVNLAAKYGIKELSNYILYNFNDTPEDLYKRLEFNIQLSENLGIHIYSFPMKYIPLFGEEAKSRYYIGSKWNRKFIRAIQSVLNVTKGIVADGRTFFEKAFGKNINEFYKILYMPEAYIIYRYFFEEIGLKSQWENLYESLSNEEKEFSFRIIESNDFKDYISKTENDKILKFLKHYTITRDDVEITKEKDMDYYNTQKHFEKLIKEDRFKNLTLTYDFE
ncbi:MAG: hypothetical protein AABZ74_07405 [Cyanobacteriota bacterium]